MNSAAGPRRECVACRPPYHAELYTTGPDVTAADLRRLVEGLGVDVRAVEALDDPARRRWTGDEIDTGRTVWLVTIERHACIASAGHLAL